MDSSGTFCMFGWQQNRKLHVTSMKAMTRAATPTQRMFFLRKFSKTVPQPYSTTSQNPRYYMFTCKIIKNVGGGKRGKKKKKVCLELPFCVCLYALSLGTAVLLLLRLPLCRFWWALSGLHYHSSW